MTFLCSDTIYELNRTHPLITPWDPTQLNGLEGSSYDLRLSSVYEVTDNYKVKPFIGVDHRVTPGTMELRTVEEEGRNVFLFLPRRFYLVRTLEAVDVPLNLVGVVRPRTTTFRCGAILQCSDVAPGYQGALTFGLVHFGERPLRVEKGARIASIRFSVLDNVETSGYGGVWAGGRVSTEGEVERGY